MKFLAVAVLSFVIMIVLMALFERSLIFFPTRYPDGLWDVEVVASGTGCVIEDRNYAAVDGVRLHSWWVRRTEGGERDPVLLFFHGNAGNLSHRAELAMMLCQRVGAQVFVAGYRGYGRSEGKPSESGLFLDARAAWNDVAATGGTRPEDVVIFGKSLGGAVAVDLAMEVDAAGLIVESSFTSIPEMAGRHYPFVPRFLIRTRMNSLAKIPFVTSPKLFIHSKTDEVVPFELGRKLFEAASEPRLFHEVLGAGHNETWLVGGEDYFRAIHDFVTNVCPGA